MSSLLLDRHDIEEAIKEYFNTYKPDLYNKYDFDNIEMYFDTKKATYLNVDLVIPEKP